MLRHLVSNIGYEVMPFKAAEESVARFVPTDVPLTVTTTAAKGVAATVDLAERLTARGYEVAPHLAARQITGRTELTEIMQRLTAAGITKAFVIGGDPPEPAGAYVDALGVLRDLNAAGSTLNTVGIGGYPEGHGTIPGPAMAQAIRDKAPLASHIVTQICFDAGTIGAWGEGLMRDNVTLPRRVENTSRSPGPPRPPDPRATCSACTSSPLTRSRAPRSGACGFVRKSALTKRREELTHDHRRTHPRCR